MQILILTYSFSNNWKIIYPPCNFFSYFYKQYHFDYHINKLIKNLFEIQFNFGLSGGVL